MTDISLSDFIDYFEAVHDQEPFPWQTRLTEHVLTTGRWPPVIDLPTGTGKTATLDTALFALAVDADRFPRRVVFVIDRRIIVDQVYERANRIAQRIGAADSGILARIRSRLAALTDGDPLGVAALRGGIPQSHEWTARPDQPWVVVSTVDQYGSRLLFRGYGVSQRMHPIHAGLAGNDCLVILDEVHLSRPFAETLRSVEFLGQRSLPHRFQVVEMSATPTHQATGRFALVDSDLAASDELRRRVKAAKTARLHPVGRRRQPAFQAIPASVDQLIERDVPAEAQTVGVIVNRVRTARETHRMLKRRGVNAHLLTGRMRPLDRARLLEAITHAIDPDRARDPSGERTVVVATQAIEVGADFSFDALVTECAPLDALRQRFGRLDRRGTYVHRNGTPAQAWILGVTADLAGADDPVYGGAVTATWRSLHDRFGDQPFGVGSLSPDLDGLPSDTSAPHRNAPLLLASHIEAWIQTQPQPIVQPDVAPFLHGLDTTSDADVNLVWRWDLSPEVLRLVPPRPAEFLPVPIGAALSWLRQVDERPVADVDAMGAEATVPLGDGRGDESIMRWSRTDRTVEEVTVPEIGPGDILLIHPSKGGLDSGTWDPEGTDEVSDLGDAAQLEHRRRVTLRLDPRIIPDAPAKRTEPADRSTREEIRAWMEETEHTGWVGEALRHLRGRFHVEAANGLDYYVVSGRYLENTGRPLPATGSAAVDLGLFDGTDETQSLIGTGTLLQDHIEGVGARAEAMAGRLGFPPEIAADLRLAGELHDIGKVDPRFQSQLVGGDPVMAAMWAGTPLAKSLPGTARVTVYPTGMRHEVGSLALTLANPHLLAPAHDPDLVLHLIASHHGHGRPLLPVVPDPDPRELRWDSRAGSSVGSDLTGTSLALDAAERFWRLVGRYGPHGLAWLEATLRLADFRQSEAEEAQRGAGTRP